MGQVRFSSHALCIDWNIDEAQCRRGSGIDSTQREGEREDRSWLLEVGSLQCQRQRNKRKLSTVEVERSEPVESQQPSTD